MSVNERGKVLHLHPDDGEQPKKKNPVGRVILLSFVLLLAAAAVCFLYLRSGLREGGAASSSTKESRNLPPGEVLHKVTQFTHKNTVHTSDLPRVWTVFWLFIHRLGRNFSQTGWVRYTSV